MPKTYSNVMLRCKNIAEDKDALSVTIINYNFYQLKLMRVKYAR